MSRHPAFEATEAVQQRFNITPGDASRVEGDPDTLRAMYEMYMGDMAEHLGVGEYLKAIGGGGPNGLPHVEDLTEPPTIVSIPLGVHRQGDHSFAGEKRMVNFYPGTITMSEEDAVNATMWAIKQTEHYPKEDNFANSHADVHSLVVRPEWGADPNRPYEVDTEPSGYGMLAVLSPEMRQAVINHRLSMGGRALYAAMPEDRVDDSFEHPTTPLAITENLGRVGANSALVLPFMKSPDHLPKGWAQQSILPVAHMENKKHLIDMGLYAPVESAEDFQGVRGKVEGGLPMVIASQDPSSCATGMSMYEGGVDANGKNRRLRMQRVKPNGKRAWKTYEGTLSAKKFLEALDEAEAAGTKMMVREFEAADTLEDLGIQLTPEDEKRFGLATEMFAIKRYYVGFDGDGKPHILGGFITARRITAKIHGANDAIMIAVNPPESEAYVQ